MYTVIQWKNSAGVIQRNEPANRTHEEKYYYTVRQVNKLTLLLEIFSSPFHPIFTSSLTLPHLTNLPHIHTCLSHGVVYHGAGFCFPLWMSPFSLSSGCANKWSFPILFDVYGTRLPPLLPINVTKQLLINYLHKLVLTEDNICP